MDPSAEGLSQHPADLLIRELIRTGRAASPNQIEQIVGRVATAPFNPSVVSVPTRYRGFAYLGRLLGSREDAVFLHLTQRVIAEGQWAIGTTPAQYLDHLRRAVRWPAARLAVYPRRGGAIAAVVNRTADVVPSQRLGAGALPWLIVVYSADRGILVTGYQFSTFDEVSMPEEARWLK